MEKIYMFIDRGDESSEVLIEKDRIVQDDLDYVLSAIQCAFTHEEQQATFEELVNAGQEAA